MKIYLQSINRWLRYTGFRLAVGYAQPNIDSEPLFLALRWFGWHNFGGWDCRPWAFIDGAWVLK